MESIKVSFKNSESIELKGILELPTGRNPHTYVLFAHCFTCNKNFHAPTNISRSLSRQGYAVLRFDFTGLGESEGDFPDTNFSGNVEDLIAASEFLSKEYEAPKILIGHSLGGAASLFAAKSIPSIKCIATINAPSSLEHVQKHFSGSLKEISEKGSADVKIGGRSFKIKEQFIKDLKKNSDQTALDEITTALLILHSPQDDIVPISHAEKLYRAAKHPKSFISLDGADHMLSNKKDSQYAGKMIAAWAEKYLDLNEEEEVVTDHQVIAELGKEGFTTTISVGKHHFIADEPKSLGGMELGPNPYEFVSSGLAACTSMTIQMYARRKKWEIEKVETHVSYNKKYASDCENCEDKSAKIDTFQREIIIKSELDEKQLNRLLEIADKCPVHKTLTSVAEIITNLKSENS